MPQYMKAAVAFIACLWHSNDKLLLVTCISQRHCEQNLERNESTEWWLESDIQLHQEKKR